MAAKKDAAAEQRFIAVRAFRSEAAATSGKRGRRLVIDQNTGEVRSLGSTWDPESRTTSYEGMAPVGQLSAKTADELAGLLATSKTPLVFADAALTAYVNEHDGQLPLEGLTGTGLDDYVDLREAAVSRRERIAEKAAEKAAASA